MASWITLFFLLVLVVVCAKPNEDTGAEDKCAELRCRGEGYECIDGQCYCTEGYILNQFHNRCIRCPTLGDKCFRTCCNTGIGNGALACWQGVCQLCYDSHGNWICRDSLDSIILSSSTQIAMASALVLGIIATFLLIYKLCAASDLRPMGNVSNYESRLSIGSLQIYVEERLRDAPPRSKNAIVNVKTGHQYHGILGGGFIQSGEPNDAVDGQILFINGQANRPAAVARLMESGAVTYWDRQMQKQIANALPSLRNRYRYSGAAPSGTAIIPATVYLNAGFLHDVPPPPYTPQKDEVNQNSAVHI